MTAATMTAATVASVAAATVAAATMTATTMTATTVAAAMTGPIGRLTAQANTACSAAGLAIGILNHVAPHLIRAGRIFALHLIVVMVLGQHHIVRSGPRVVMGRKGR